jgi:hypothetical protein
MAAPEFLFTLLLKYGVRYLAPGVVASRRLIEGTLRLRAGA